MGSFYDSIAGVAASWATGARAVPPSRGRGRDRCSRRRLPGADRVQAGRSPRERPAGTPWPGGRACTRGLLGERRGGDRSGTTAGAGVPGRCSPGGVPLRTEPDLRDRGSRGTRRRRPLAPPHQGARPPARRLRGERESARAGHGRVRRATRSRSLDTRGSPHGDSALRPGRHTVSPTSRQVGRPPSDVRDHPPQPGPRRRRAAAPVRVVHGQRCEHREDVLNERPDER